MIPNNNTALWTSKLQQAFLSRGVHPFDAHARACSIRDSAFRTSTSIQEFESKIQQQIQYILSVSPQMLERIGVSTSNQQQEQKPNIAFQQQQYQQQQQIISNNQLSSSNVTMSPLPQQQQQLQQQIFPHPSNNSTIAPNINEASVNSTITQNNMHQKLKLQLEEDHAMQEAKKRKLEPVVSVYLEKMQFSYLQLLLLHLERELLLLQKQPLPMTRFTVLLENIDLKKNYKEMLEKETDHFNLLLEVSKLPTELLLPMFEIDGIFLSELIFFKSRMGKTSCVEMLSQLFSGEEQANQAALNYQNAHLQKIRNIFSTLSDIQCALAYMQKYGRSILHFKLASVYNLQFVASTKIVRRIAKMKKKNSDEEELIVSIKRPVECVITKTPIQSPVRDIVCRHVFEQSNIIELLKNKNNISCPYSGCKNKICLGQLYATTRLIGEYEQKRREAIHRRPAIDLNQIDIDSDDDI
jgi:hypothetical protein